MEKTSLLKASKEDKLMFYRKEFFEDAQIMKKGLFFIIFGIYTCETLHNLFIIPSALFLRTPTSQIVTIVAYIVTSVCFYISLFRSFGKSSEKVFYFKYWAAFLGTVGLSFSLAYNTFFVMQSHITSSRPDEWLYALITERSEVWIVLIIDLVIPIWYLKLMVPTAYWVVQIVFYNEQDFDYKGMIWERFILFTFYTAVLWGVKAYLQWKAFLGRLNVDAWSEVQKYILDKVPDAIAIIDADCKVFYSNSSFKNLCNDDLETLSKSFCDIKKSHSYGEPRNYPNTFEEEYKSPKASDNLTQTKADENPAYFTRLIETVIESVIKNTINPKDFLSFIAKRKSQNSSGEKVFSYEMKIIPLIEYKKIILMLDDTTQRDLAVSLEAINLYKDKLLAMVSHDLRAPINGSLTFIENSIDHKSVPVFVKDQFLVPAQRSCKFLLHLVNDILDFSQINAQKLRMSFENFSIIETIKNCYQLVEVQAKQKNLILSLDIDNKLPEEFNTDHNRVSQIIINLLTNAIKFTSKGMVSLKATLIDDSLLEIKVADTGIGMKEQDQKKLFQDFTRIEYEQAEMNTRGIGLGLAIANQLAQRLGPKDNRTGGIKVSSVYGKGSTFSFLLEENDPDLSKPKILTSRRRNRKQLRSGVSFFLLPEEGISLDDIDELNTSRTKASSRPPYISHFRNNSIAQNHIPQTKDDLEFGQTQSQEPDPIKVLVVDDDALNVLALTSLLKPFGLNIDSAFNGEEAIEKVANIGTPLRLSHLDSSRETWNREKKANEYKMIFMDCEMPILDGQQASKILCEMMNNGELKSIPIIGCTGHYEEAQIEACYKSGMKEVITKPISKEKLKRCLKKYLDIDSPS